LASLTVIGPSLTWADAFATAAFVLGENGPAWVEQFDGYTAFGVRPDGGIVGRAVASDLLGARRLGYDPDPLPRG
jgi:thiamine biosynthesis lipoprotein ApbE